MRLQLTWTLALFFAMLQFSFAQLKVSGKVSDESGIPLPGVTVLVKGSSKGTQTDFDGNYQILVKEGKTLVFSYVGMKTTERKVVGNSAINVVLKTDAEELGEVVVTGAMGLERKPRELSYSVTSVKNDDITASNSVNAASAMAGKVSGLQINIVNNSVNPNTRVVLRGYRSLLSNNQALIVVDGFPSPRGVLDRINPDDIAEVTVLKGANASALYGSEAANGVLVITTKRGKSKLTTTLHSSIELESISYMPQFQEEFGVGGFPDGTLQPLENVNWGPRYDGRMVNASEVLENGDVWKVPFTPIKNNHKSFFETGYGYRNGLTISSGDGKSNILFSIDRLDKTGVVPKDKYNRTNVRLNAGKKVGKFEFTGNFTFFNSNKDVVSNKTGKQERPFYWSVINTPLHIPITQMKNWRDGKFTRNEVSYYRFYENPYFLIDSNRSKSKYNEFTFIGSAKYDFTSWLSAQLRVGYTSYGSVKKVEKDALTYAFHLPNTYGTIKPYGASTIDDIEEFSRLNSDFLINIDKELSDNVSFKANLGHNVRIDNKNYIKVSGDNLIIPNFYNISTRKGELGGDQLTTNYRKVGVFADMTLAINNYLFFNATVRNDWSSALSKENRSFFYPGGGVSVVLSEVFPSIKGDKGLSYLKLSGNITKSGNDPGAYYNQGIFYSPKGFPYGSIAGLSQSSIAVDKNLKPEFTTSTEASLEFALFKNRITSSVTYYRTLTTDQIISVDVSTASGAKLLKTNLGEVENKGLELDINLAILRDSDFKWDLGVNYSGYYSKVLSLKEGTNELSIGGYSNASIIARVGESYPLIRTSAYLRDNQGRVIVDASGDPKQDSKNKVMGKTTPDYVLGLNTSFKYKGFKLYINADYKTGHVFYNNLAEALEFTGLAKHSVTSGRKPFVFPNSSYSDGKGGYIANTDRLTSGGGNAFWSKYQDVKENYVTDATTLRIREISLTYDVDLEVLKKIGIETLNVGVYSRNPFTFLPKSNVYTDPEFNYSTGNEVGIGTDAQTPPTRLFGLKLTTKF